MINNEFSVSVKQDSNLVYCSTAASAAFKNIQAGCLIKIGDDKVFYEIASKKDENLVKPFTQTNGCLVLEGDCGLEILAEDTISITFKEYQILGIFSILNPGSGYRKDEIVLIDKGIANYDVYTGTEKYTSIKVKDVDANGGITSLEVIEKGLYLVKPDKEVTVNGIRGREAKILVEYMPVSSRKSFERKVIGKKYEDGYTVIHLDSPINRHIIEGEISIEKSVLGLNTDYTPNTKISAPFEIVKDFTKHLGIPLMAPNTMSREIIFNKAMNKIDEQLHSIMLSVDNLRKAHPDVAGQ